MSTATVSPYVWKESYSVGIQTIDAQHKQLISLIAKLQDAMAQSRGRGVVGPILNEVVHYTRAHFATEEKLMESNGYPDFAAHRAIHTELTRAVLDLQSRFTAEEVALSVHTLQFLKEWLVDHIFGADQKYAPFLSAKGVR